MLTDREIRIVRLRGMYEQLLVDCHNCLSGMTEVEYALPMAALRQAIDHIMGELSKPPFTPTIN